MLESKVQSICIKYLNNTKGIKATRHHPVTVGEPDVICCIFGKYVEIEFKKFDGVQSDVQKLSMKKTIVAGGEYWIIKSLTQLIDLVEHLRKNI